MDNNDKKLKFIEAMTRHGLSHFDNGGIANFLGAGNNFSASGQPSDQQLDAAYSGVQSGLNQQQNFVNHAGAQNGFGNQSNVFAQQQALANQLKDQANGIGPNVAQNQLNQATANNIANQGAMAAGQRGAGANVGLIARQVGQQGAATQQQAAGQAATLGAQQQIAAQQGLANQQAQMQSVAGNQIQTQGQGLNSFNAAQQGNQNALYGANANANNINAQVEMGNQKANSNIIGGILGGIGTIGAAAAMAKGGMAEDPQSSVGRFMKGMAPQSLENGGAAKAQAPSQKAVVKGNSFKNDKIPAMLSEDEIVIPREIVMHKNAPELAAKFVAASIAKKRMGKK